MNEEETKVEVTETEEVKVEETKAEEVVAAEPVQEKVPAEEKKDLDLTNVFDVVKKNIKWIAVAVAALILICIIGSVVANSGSRFTLISQEKLYFQVGKDMLVSFDGDEIISDENISGMAYSADYSLAVVKDKDATLFIVDGTELVEVAEEVYSFVISDYGDTIAYMTEVEDGVGTLNLYNVSKKSSAVIDKEASAGDVILSADGKSVAYVGDCEVEEGWFSSNVTGSVYVSKNGKEGKEVSKDAVPLAVTDGGKYVFYIKDGEKLYMNEEKLASDIASRVYFNQDYTEIIFNEDDDVMYFAVKMKEPVKVKKGNFRGIYAPEAMVEKTANTSNSAYAMETYGVDSFNKLLWQIDSGEAYFVYDKGEETEKLSSYLSEYQMTENGKSMLYMDGGDLVLIENIEKSREGERVAHGLYFSNGFAASKDLKDIYYYNSEDDELCYWKKDKGVHIADDAEQFVYSDKYGVVYFIEDDELFCATKNAKSKKDVCGEEVESVMVLNGEVYFMFREDDEYSIRKLTGKTKYETVYELDIEDLWNIKFDY